MWWKEIHKQREEKLFQDWLDLFMELLTISVSNDIIQTRKGNNKNGKRRNDIGTKGRL